MTQNPAGGEGRRTVRGRSERWIGKEKLWDSEAASETEGREETMEQRRNTALQPGWAAPLRHSALAYDSQRASVRGCPCSWDARVRHTTLFVTAAMRAKAKESMKGLEGWKAAGWKRWGIQGL